MDSFPCLIKIHCENRNTLRFTTVVFIQQSQEEEEEDLRWKGIVHQLNALAANKIGRGRKKDKEAA